MTEAGAPNSETHVYLFGRVCPTEIQDLFSELQQLQQKHAAEITNIRAHQTFLTESRGSGVQQTLRLTEFCALKPDCFKQKLEKPSLSFTDLIHTVNCSKSDMSYGYFFLTLQSFTG